MVDGEVKHSEAKSIVAQQKPRDAQGKFLSGEELAAYRVQAQQQQFDAERAKMNSILGRREDMQQPQQQMQQPMGMPVRQPMQQPSQNNFMDIINANKPGFRNNNVSGDPEADKWDMLLGRRKRG